MKEEKKEEKKKKKDIHFFQKKTKKSKKKDIHFFQLRNLWVSYSSLNGLFRVFVQRVLLI